MRRTAAAVATAAVLAAGCRRDPHPARTFDVTGAWRAEYPAPGGGGTVTLALAQTGDRVSGSGVVRSAPDREPYPFTVSGRVADPEVTLHFATLAGCPASFAGRLSGARRAREADTLAGRFDPSPCLVPVPAIVFVRRR